MNIAGFAAENILLNRIKTIYWDDAALVSEDSLILDIRTEEEFSTGHINNAFSISLDDLRNRLTELPREERIYVYCQIGLRGYMATRILLQNGFTKVYNLSGGYRLWKVSTSEQAKAVDQRGLQLVK